ncbi:MAG: dienelactone hydrolase family protein [Tolypothrix brevis GSE-NOS-MK-07-07A]|jgi:carboxymethylenebutenolidase|nr:dienelactone hydrolase family protein [Tolypothrix brevis GSE-NOS-MK-07-07A]
MKNIEIQTTKVKISNNELQIDAYLAKPLENGNYGAVIVFHEIFGVNENIRDITELIAKQGYIAIAPAMYQRIAPGFEFGFSEPDIGFSPQAYQLGLHYYQKDGMFSKLRLFYLNFQSYCHLIMNGCHQQNESI